MGVIRTGGRGEAEVGEVSEDVGEVTEEDVEEEVVVVVVVDWLIKGEEREST